MKNPKKPKWTRPAPQIGYKALTIRDVSVDMKNEPNNTSEFKSCVKFVSRCEQLLTTRQFATEGYACVDKFRIVGVKDPKKMSKRESSIFPILC